MKVVKFIFWCIGALGPCLVATLLAQKHPSWGIPVLVFMLLWLSVFDLVTSNWFPDGKVLEDPLGRLKDLTDDPPNS